MKRYPKLKYPEHEDSRGLFTDGTVVVTEKLDGSNFRFKYTGDGFVFGSRNTYGEQLHRDQFKDPIEYVKRSVDLDTLKDVCDEYGELVFFGEAMLPHTISYDWENTPFFIGFDVWNVDSEVFHHTEQAKNIFEDIGLPFTPILNTLAAPKAEGVDFTVPESNYYDGLAEGLVLKNHTTATYSKIVRDEFKEKAKQKFGASKKTNLSDTELTVEEYVTPARVKSVARQLVDDGKWEKIELPMMEILPEAVIRDMAQEEAGNIFMQENRKIDTQEFRSLTSKRCVEVVKQMVDQRKRAELQG